MLQMTMSSSKMQPKNKQRVKLCFSWALVALLCGIIFYFSHQVASVSSGQSGSLLEALFCCFHIRLSQHAIRKMAHAFEYLCLSMAFYNAYFQTFRRPQSALAVLSAVLFATADEMHQYFILGRACQVSDVFVDASGALAGAFICMLIFAGYQKFHKKKNQKEGF